MDGHDQPGVGDREHPADPGARRRPVAVRVPGGGPREARRTGEGADVAWLLPPDPGCIFAVYHLSGRFLPGDAPLTHMSDPKLFDSAMVLLKGEAGDLRGSAPHPPKEPGSSVHF